MDGQPVGSFLSVIYKKKKLRHYHLFLEQAIWQSSEERLWRGGNVGCIKCIKAQHKLHWCRWSVCGVVTSRATHWGIRPHLQQVFAEGQPAQGNSDLQLYDHGSQKKLQKGLNVTHFCFPQVQASSSLCTPHFCKALSVLGCQLNMLINCYTITIDPFLTRFLNTEIWPVLFTLCTCLNK